MSSFQMSITGRLTYGQQTFAATGDAKLDLASGASASQGSSVSALATTFSSLGFSDLALPKVTLPAEGGKEFSLSTSFTTMSSPVKYIIKAELDASGNVLDPENLAKQVDETVKNLQRRKTQAGMEASGVIKVTTGVTELVVNSFNIGEQGMELLINYINDSIPKTKRKFGAALKSGA